MSGAEKNISNTVEKFLFPAFALFAGVCFLIAGSFFPLHQDENVFLTIAAAINYGYLPYRDFFDHKPPLIYGLFALIFSLFKTKLLTARLSLFLLNLVNGCIFYKISRVYLNRQRAYLALGIFFMLTVLLHGNFVLTEVLLNSFLLLALNIYLRAPRIKRSFFLLGLYLGLALLTKQQAISFLLFFTLMIWRKDSKTRGLIFFNVCAGVLVPIFLTLVFFLKLGILESAAEQIFNYNLLYYKPAGLFSTLSGTFKIFFPFLVLWLVFFYQTLKKWRNNHLSLMALTFLVCGLPFYLFRPYHHYWLPLATFAALLAVCGIEKNKFLSGMLAVNMFLVLVIYLNYARKTANPQLLAQIANAGQITDCSLTPPDLYFLTGCILGSKYFYRPF